MEFFHFYGIFISVHGAPLPMLDLASGFAFGAVFPLCVIVLLSLFFKEKPGTVARKCEKTYYKIAWKHSVGTTLSSLKPMLKSIPEIVVPNRGKTLTQQWEKDPKTTFSRLIFKSTKLENIPENLAENLALLFLFFQKETSFEKAIKKAVESYTKGCKKKECNYAKKIRGFKIVLVVC